MLFNPYPIQGLSHLVTIHSWVKQDRICSAIGFGAQKALDVSNAGSGRLLRQGNAAKLLNINQNKKLEDLMANSTDNQVKSSMLGAVTQGR